MVHSDKPAPLAKAVLKARPDQEQPAAVPAAVPAAAHTAAARRPGMANLPPPVPTKDPSAAVPDREAQLDAREARLGVREQALTDTMDAIEAHLNKLAQRDAMLLAKERDLETAQKALHAREKELTESQLLLDKHRAEQTADLQKERHEHNLKLKKDLDAARKKCDKSRLLDCTGATRVARTASHLGTRLA